MPRPEPPDSLLTRAAASPLSRGAAVWLLLVPLLWLPGAPSHAASGDAVQKSRELDQVQGRIKALRQSLEEARGRETGARAQIEASERAIGKVTGRIAALERQSGAAQERLKRLEAERVRQRAGLMQQRQALGRELRASYMAGRSEYLKLLLNQEDPHRLGRMLVYYEYLGRARKARIEGLQSALAELDRVGREIAAESAELDRLQEGLDRERAALEQQRQERREVLAALGREIRTSDQQLKGLLDDERRLQKVLETLRNALADIPVTLGNRAPIGKQRGQLLWPASGKVVASFGSERGLGALKWNGMLIDAPAGASVRAVHHGRVAFADWLRGFGLLMIVDHGDGFMSLYGHNQNLLKEAGDWVEAGEVIATVGQSGGRESPGLYFELRRDGRPTDPQPWLARR